MRVAHHWGLRIGVLLSGVLVCCGSPQSNLEVVIEAEQEVANRSTRVSFQVRSQEGDVALSEQFDLVQTPFPIRRLISPRGGDASRVVTITAQAVGANGETLTTARTIRSFIHGRTVEVRLRLYEVCLGTNCPEGMTCEPINGRAECVDARVIDNPNDAGINGNTDDTSTECANGFQRCGDDCVRANTVNACGPSCAVCTGDGRGTALCMEGVCTVSCNQGFESCGTANGPRCVDTETDRRHCGRCGNLCPDEKLCVSGNCVEPPECDVNNPASCVGLTYCNSANNRCAPGCDPRLSNQCGSSQTCTTNQCVCSTGTHDCSGACLSNGSVNSCGTTSCSPCMLATNATQMGCNGTNCTVSTCIAGYQVSSNQQTCEDINECLNSNGGCHANATCGNTPGSRTCMCNPGFTGSGLVCMPSTSMPTWQQVSTTGPSVRALHAMAYDSTLNRVVLFGGAGSGGDRNDTWVLSGSTWSQINGPAPSARNSHAMAYDSTLNRVVLFGGFSTGSWLDDTWVLSGGTWSQINGPGPSARFGHAMAYDSALNRVVLFGGTEGNYREGNRNDTWVLSGSTWSQISGPSGPYARYDCAMVYDSALNRVVLFGGQSGSGTLNHDTWALSGSTWSQIAGPGPSGRSRHAMAYDSALNRVVLFGGRTSSNSHINDTWALSGSNWSQISGPGPSARDSHAMAYDSALNRVVLFGGSYLNDTWVFE